MTSAASIAGSGKRGIASGTRMRVAMTTARITPSKALTSSFGGVVGGPRIRDGHRVPIGSTSSMRMRLLMRPFDS